MCNRAWLVVAVLVCSFRLNAEDYRAEAEILAREIVDIHPRGQEIGRDPDFIAARDALLSMAGNSEFPRYAMAVGRMFHAANDGHTASIPFYSDHAEFKWRYPIRLKRFDDGLYVSAAKGVARALLGARLIRIGGKDIDHILSEFEAVQASGNRAWPANWTALAMVIPGFLAGLEIAPEAMTSAVRFEAVNAKDETVSAAVLPTAKGHQDLEAIAHAGQPLDGLGDGASNFVTEIGAALVLVIGAMEDETPKTFGNFTEEAGSALTISQAERVIIDLRDNGGGNNLLAEPLRRMIIKSRFNRPGGIYVLISPQTFSAAMNFATRIERETDALFVGEPTGGSPNHFGDPKFSRTEQSGLPYLISTLLWQDMPPFDERPWILPDIPASPRFEDFVAGRDLALERALEHRPTKGPEWELRKSQPWARESQRAEWRFFYEASD